MQAICAAVLCALLVVITPVEGNVPRFLFVTMMIEHTVPRPQCDNRSVSVYCCGKYWCVSDQVE